MNIFELSSILYYADFLSLQNESDTVTDNCKYFYIHGVPMNSSYIADVEPVYDMNNQYFKQAFTEYNTLKSKFGDDGAESFLDNLCNLGVAGSVNAVQMLKYIHRYDDKDERAAAFKKYNKNLKNRKYTHLINEDGELVEQECSKYVAHTEASRLR